MGLMDIPIGVRRAVESVGLEAAAVEGALERLAQYLDLLFEANQRVNLTAVRDRELAWGRLVLESLAPVDRLKGLAEGAELIDVGAGGGVPGIPLAIVLPELRVTLLEATGKKANFIERCVGELGLEGAGVVHGRAETVGHDPAHRGRYGAAVCRGVGPMNRVLEYMLPLVRVGGEAIAIKGPEVGEDELRDMDRAIEVLGGGHVDVVEASGVDGSDGMVVVSVAKESPTPKTYPRLPGVPAQNPLV